jgi:hypothetical protein
MHGKGERTSFWLQGRNPAQIAPALLPFVWAKEGKKRIVAEALTEHRWIADLRGELSVQRWLNTLAYGI